MRFWQSMAGMVRLELTSADISASLEALTKADIALFQLEPVGELELCFSAARKDYARIRKITRQRGDGLKLCRKMGLYWKLQALLARPVLLGGLTLLALLLALLPTRVFFIQVSGNHLVSTNRILWAAENCGLRFGASRRAVRSEKLKNALLSAIPELQWAGVNTHGCVAVISVTEKAARTPEEAPQTGVSSLVSVRDAVVTSCTVTRGSPLCKPGQAVVKGQVLISGYTDCGICIQGGQAEGEIFGITERKADAVTPAVYTARRTRAASRRRWCLILGKKRINLWFGSGIWDGECGRMYQEYPLTLPGGFTLPAALAVEETVTYDLTAEEVPPELAGSHLTELTWQRLRASMAAGSVLNRTEAVTREGALYRLTGTYGCLESIGAVQWEQIGETNG